MTTFPYLFTLKMLKKKKKYFPLKDKEKLLKIFYIFNNFTLEIKYKVVMNFSGFFLSLRRYNRPIYSRPKSL